MDTKRSKALAGVWAAAALVFVAAIVSTFQAAGGATLGQMLQPWLVISATVMVLGAVVASMAVAIHR